MARPVSEILADMQRLLVRADSATSSIYLRAGELASFYADFRGLLSDFEALELRARPRTSPTPQADARQHLIEVGEAMDSARVSLDLAKENVDRLQ